MTGCPVRGLDWLRTGLSCIHGTVSNRSYENDFPAALRCLGQTQQQVADKLGVTNATVSRDLSEFTNVNSLPETITNSRGEARPAAYKKKEKEMPATLIFQMENQIPSRTLADKIGVTQQAVSNDVTKICNVAETA